MTRMKAALIGSGNIGTDLLLKAVGNEYVEPAWMIGIDARSKGLAMARERGLRVTDEGLDGFLDAADSRDVRLAFDATSASAHSANAQRLRERGVFVVDLTPAAIGPFCVPVVNLEEQLGRNESNVNMVTCGGQATIPLVAAVSRVQRVVYAEIVATIASRSAGPGTRQNIDEFTRTTARGLEKVGGANEGKAIIILNPAEPPLVMRDTVHCLTADEPDRDAITSSAMQMVRAVQEYVPGYRLANGPVFDGRRVSFFLEVRGRGDYLPAYAGNLDIMTAAALRVGQLYARQVGARIDPQ